MKSTSFVDTRDAAKPAIRDTAIRALMYTAESQKGHARYTRDLLTALTHAGRERGDSFELVTSADLTAPYRSTLYPIHPILPPLKERALFPTTLHWGVSRVTHYARRERTFLRWLRTRPDLNLAHFQEYTPWLAPWHYPAIRRQGIAVVATVHNVINFSHLSRAYVRQMIRCWKSAWRSCSALLVHTEGLRDRLSDFLGPGHPPIHVTPHAVWEERSTPPVSASLPTAGAPAHLLFFGMIRPNKGVHVLLNAMERLPGCTLTIAGDPESDSYLAEVRALADRLPEGRVRMLTGFVAESEIAGHFDRSHLVILPYTEFAAQSGVLHQALAHGRPVVASDIGGMGESVRAWGIGEVVRPQDASALAEGITRALRPETYRDASDATMAVRGRLTWESMAEATLDVYRAIVP